MPFAKGDLVRLKTPVIQGPVLDGTYDMDAQAFSYRLAFTDADGQEHDRWFTEGELELVPGLEGSANG